MKIQTIYILVLTVLVSFLVGGCYTQFSRPEVDTEYYSEDDEEEYHEEEYYDDEYVSHYDVYGYGGPSVYWGPQAWMYWSPYYRWYHPYHYSDPWWYYSYGYGFYDPFWDPWYDQWAYYNYYYYHPRHHYYWNYDHGSRYWAERPEKQRDFDRRDSDYSSRRSKTRTSMLIGSGIENNRLKKRPIDENLDGRRVTRTGGEDRRMGTVSKENPVPANQRPDVVRRPITERRPELITQPQGRKSPTDRSSTQRVKRSTRSKSSSSSPQIKSPSSRSRSSSSTPAPTSKSSGSKSSGDNNKSSDSGKKRK